MRLRKRQRRKKRKQRTAAALGLGVALWAASAPDARAAEPDPRRVRAERLVAEGRCVAALSELEALRAEHPGDARLALLAGGCAIRLERFDAAARALEDARRLAPDDARAALQLGVARYHLGDLPGAASALAEAERAEPALAHEAELLLYRGLVRLARGEPALAAADLAAARRADAGFAEPVASYYEGLAWIELGELAKADRALARAVAAAPESEWGSRAEAQRTRIRMASRPRGWIRGEAGLEYDSNLVLLGKGVVLPAEISDERDVRGVWGASAGLELLRTRDWVVGALATYAGTAQVDLTDFDQHFPTLSLWVDRALGRRWSARGQADFGYGWVGGAPFVASWDGGVALVREGGTQGRTTLAARGFHADYFFRNNDVPDGPGVVGGPCPGSALLCAPPGIDEGSERNRDGSGARFGLEHALPLPWRVPLPAASGADAVPTVRAGYRYHFYDARGREYSRQGHRVAAGLASPLALGVVADVEASFAYLPYRHPSTFPDPRALRSLTAGQQYGLASADRRDREVRVAVALERPLGPAVALALRWDYVDNASNVAVYDYDRHVVGVSLRVALER